MKWKLSGMCALSLVLAACGDKGAVTEQPLNATTASDHVVVSETEGSKCNLLSEAIASKDGWFAVKRGSDELQAKSVKIGADMVAFLKTVDSQFDSGANCVQLLKGSDGKAFLEIGAEACNENGVLGEERAHTFRLSLGSVIEMQEPAPAAETAVEDQGKDKEKEKVPETEPAPKAEKGDTCKMSRYPVIFSGKAGERNVGELLIDLRLEAAPVKEPESPKQEEPSQKQEEPKPKQEVPAQKQEEPAPKQEEPIQTQEAKDTSNLIRHYDISLVKLCNAEFASVCKVSAGQGHLDGVEITAQASAPTEQGKVPEQQQQKQTPKVETPKQEAPPVQKQEEPKQEEPVQKQKQPEAPVKQQEPVKQEPVKQEPAKP